LKFGEEAGHENLPLSWLRVDLKKMLQIPVWLKTICFYSFYQAVNCCTGMGSMGRTLKQPVFSVHYKRTNGIFNNIVKLADQTFMVSLETNQIKQNTESFIHQSGLLRFP